MPFTESWYVAAALALLPLLSAGAQPAPVSLEHPGEVLAAAFSPDGALLATGCGDHAIRLWDLAAGREIRKLAGHKREVTSLAFSADGRHLASGSGDRTIGLWETASGGEVLRLRGHEEGILSVAFSPDGRTLASGGPDKTVRLWDVVRPGPGGGAASGKERGKLEGHEGRITAVAFSPDGKLLASASFDHSIILWDAGTGKKIRRVAAQRGSIYSMAFSPDGRTLASGGGITDPTIRVWAYERGEAPAGAGAEALKVKELLNWKAADHVFSVAYSPDGRLIASGTGNASNLIARAAIQVWESASGRELMKLEGHAGNIHAVAFSPDGKRLATASGDKTARLWAIAGDR